jgi:long-chain acyl-CoA synthetase
MIAVDDTVRWGERVVQGSVRGNPTLLYEPRVRSVGAILREGRRWADRDFIVQGERRVTFAEHERAVARLARQLAARGIGVGDRVALFAPNSPEWSATFFAVLEVGAIVVPCNSWWSADEVAHACTMTEPSVVIADERRAERLPSERPVVSLEEISTAFAAQGGEDDLDTASVRVDEDENRAGIILFTSGTTGFPKGATLTHRSLVANVQSLLLMSGRLPHQIPDDLPPSVTFASLPLFHIGAIQVLLLSFVSGTRLVFPAARFDAGEVVDAIEQEGVTMWSAVPTMVERVLAHPELEHRDVSSLRTVVLGGAPVSANLLERVSQAFPNAKRNVGQAYGLSEAGGVLTTAIAKSGRAGSAGRVVPVAEIRIDEPDEHGIGEIVARSPAVMDGYWGLPDDPILTSDGWLHSGDLGRLDDDGFLTVTGRLKDMIIRGGENIAPAHIETYLLEHPDVREVAVIGLPHPDLGEEVAAVVALAPDANVTTEELSAFVRGRLAHFEVPSRWWVHDGELPKNDTGKILKRTLREQWST